jgi:hypothetical protein
VETILEYTVLGILVGDFLSMRAWLTLGLLRPPYVSDKGDYTQAAQDEIDDSV